MSEEDIKRIVRATLTELGADTTDPIEMQRDLAFLRSVRKGYSAGTGRFVLVIVTGLATGLGLAIWHGIQFLLGQK